MYALSGDEGDDAMFSVSTMGSEAVLKLRGQLDYEGKNIYQLRVREGGGEGGCTICGLVGVLSGTLTYLIVNVRM